MSNHLVWNNYGKWLGTDTSYFIFRRVDGILDPIPVATSLHQTDYTDNVSTLTYTNGIFDYYIIAQEGNIIPNIYGFEDTARSNEVRVFQKPKMYIPSAFIPGGNENNVFLPIGAFANSADYKLTIFNRWGKQIFETKKYTEGWNGMVDGKIADLGVYTYILQFTTSDGNKFERAGTFSLIR